MKVLYTDVDGTLVGPGGYLLHSPRIAHALVRARDAGLAVVPVSGRGRLQLRELCRLLGLPRAIGELGCVHVEGHEVRYEFGAFPFTGRTPVEAMEAEGAIDCALSLGFEPHDPWNEGREATFLLRGDVDLAEANAALDRAGFHWCRLLDNGRVVHLAPTGVGKPFGVQVDMAGHVVAVADAAYVGDTASDVACAELVGRFWLVANADPGLSGRRTEGAYGDGVAEVIDSLI